MVRRIAAHELQALLPDILLVDNELDAKYNTKAHSGLLKSPDVRML